MAKQIESSSRLNSDSEIWPPSGRRTTLRGSRIGQFLGPTIDFICSFVPAYFEGDLNSGAPALTEEGKRVIEEIMKI
jgi:hypothetical protein